MRRLFVFVPFLVAPALALGAATVGPPGGPAPKPLIGVWKVQITPAELHKLEYPGSKRGWQINFINGKYDKYARALGFGPANERSDAVPYGVTGSKVYLSCLNEEGAPIAGYATYSWTVAGGSLRFKLVKEPCKNALLRDRIVILTGHPWHR
jgi:hypothetical protein